MSKKRDNMIKDLKGFELRKHRGGFLRKLIILLIIILILMYIFERDILISIWEYINGLF